MPPRSLHMAQWSADPSGHWTQHKLHDQHYALLTGQGAPCPNPLPLTSAPTAAQPCPAACRAGWAPGPSAWMQEGPKAWDPRWQEASSTSAPGLRAGATSHALPLAMVPRGLNEAGGTPGGGKRLREGVLSRFDCPSCCLKASAGSAGGERPLWAPCPAASTQTPPSPGTAGHPRAHVCVYQKEQKAQGSHRAPGHP